MEGLRTNGVLRVGKVLVEPYIKPWLLKEGRRQGASRAAMRWAQRTIRYAGPNAGDHKDHFHVAFLRP